MAKRTIQLEPRSAQAFSSSNASQAFPSRKLKVRKGYYHYQHSDFQPRQNHHSCQPVPWVQIKGYWLNKAGFIIGTQLNVKVQNGCITIKPATSPS